MILNALFGLLLADKSGQNDLLIGSPVAGRNRPELKGVIGCFVNTVVLRHQLDHAQSFVALLKQTREATLGAFAHQDVPLEKVIEAISPQRALSHSPLFQVLFVLQTAPSEALALPGIEFASFPLSNQHGTARFNLRASAACGRTARRFYL